MSNPQVGDSQETASQFRDKLGSALALCFGTMKRVILKVHQNKGKLESSLIFTTSMEVRPGDLDMLTKIGVLIVSHNALPAGPAETRGQKERRERSRQYRLPTVLYSFILNDVGLDGKMVVHAGQQVSSSPPPSSSRRKSGPPSSRGERVPRSESSGFPKSRAGIAKLAEESLVPEDDDVPTVPWRSRRGVVGGGDQANG